MKANQGPHVSREHASLSFSPPSILTGVEALRIVDQNALGHAVSALDGPSRSEHFDPLVVPERASP